MADEADYVLQFVRDTDVPCPTCGYNLRDLQVPRCPECGDALRLRLVLAEPRLGLWLATLIPVLAAAGVGVMFAALMVPKGLSNNMRGAGAMTAFFLAIPLAGVAIGLRRWHVRLPRGLQVVLAAASILLVAGLFLWGAVAIK